MRVDQRTCEPRADFSPKGLGRDAIVEPSGVRHPASFLCSYEKSDGEVVDFGAILNVRDREWMLDIWDEGAFYGTLTECVDEAVREAEALATLH